MKKRIKLTENDIVSPCPLCGNNTKFEANSERVAEDCCVVWVNCQCGHETDADDRLEDVWGSLDKDTITAALYCWNDTVSQRRAIELPEGE